MRNLTSVFAGAAITLVVIQPAFAEENAMRLTHPGDTTQAYATAIAADPFALAVPLLERDVPVPSYGQPTPAKGADPIADMDKAMEMDHSNMPGMTPGMTEDSN